MAFVKYWLVLEAAFSGGDGEVTETLSREAATLLVFGGCGVKPVEEHDQLSTQLKNLYTIRCRIVHRGRESSQPSAQDLGNMADFAAHAVVTFASLRNRGYKTIAQIVREAARLRDRLSARDTTSTA
jgi:hypothetical protein